MQVIDPVILTDAMFVSSTAAETDYTVWAFGTFVVGDKRMMTTGIHKNYECLVGHTSTDATGAPNLNLTGTAPKWLELSSTNRWNMFDQQNSTQTSVTSPLTVVIKPGVCDSLALMELVGASATVSVKDQSGGTVVYTDTKNLDGSLIIDWYTYFFEPFGQLESWVLSKVIPPYPAPEITMTLTGTSTVKCGVMVAGTAYDIGSAQYGASFGITDYSIKSTNSFGTTSITRRRYAKKMDVRLMLDNAYINQVATLLAGLRSTPAVWVGTSSATYAPLVVYGFYKDWNVEITYPNNSLVSLSIEGLT